LKLWYFSGFFLPIAWIGKFTAMIALHLHQQPQHKYEFHIYFTENCQWYKDKLMILHDCQLFITYVMLYFSDNADN